ncbi:hypothetical protein BURMUCGD1_0955 [Burkholderia multivorans CGD1]|nr:hypothetical protein BURMUCGD1_0955 [Burkholderia multivorans CGD1]
MTYRGALAHQSNACNRDHGGRRGKPAIQSGAAERAAAATRKP